jgi:hypothetical protein
MKKTIDDRLRAVCKKLNVAPLSVVTYWDAKDVVINTGAGVFSGETLEACVLAAEKKCGLYKPPSKFKVRFSLTMPVVKSWNGRWSGADEPHYEVRNVSRKTVEKLGIMDAPKSWSYRFDDGWVAEVTAQISNPSMPKAPSAGFCGYDWMIDSILRHSDLVMEKVP